MNQPIKYLLILFSLIVLVCNVSGQVDEICAEAGYTPSLDSPFAHIPYIYGRIILKGFDPGAKLPNVTISMMDSQQSGSRITIGKSGNYCFKMRNSSGGVLAV